uniref:CRAL-TRIO domain-containing protein n=1 Tax=Parascaris univalens TaxID=6257 RepID=A0A915AQH7_PARUN
MPMRCRTNGIHLTDQNSLLSSICRLFFEKMAITIKPSYQKISILFMCVLVKVILLRVMQKVAIAFHGFWSQMRNSHSLSSDLMRKMVAIHEQWRRFIRALDGCLVLL